MRAQPTSFNTQTGAFTSGPNQQPTNVLLYDRFDWEPVVKGGLILLVVGALLGGIGWFVTAMVDHSNYKGCDTVRLCNDITRAKVQSDITRAGDDAGGFIIPPHRTNAPVTVAAPPASAVVAPRATAVASGTSSPAPEWGRCFLDKDPAKKGYIGSDGRCYNAPHGTPADPRPRP